MTKYYIYTLTNPKNGDIFYVGCTKQPEIRAYQHAHSNGLNSPGWKNEYLKEMNCHPKLTVVQVVEAMPLENTNQFPVAAREAEYAWINKMASEGHKLFNSNLKLAPIQASRESDKLTDSEVKKLRRIILGYGKFQTIADKAGLHKQTLRGIVQRGYGIPENISKVRKVLEPAKIDNQNI